MNSLQIKASALQERVDNCIADIEAQLRAKVCELVKKREDRAAQLCMSLLSQTVPFNRDWIRDEFRELHEALGSDEENVAASIKAYRDALDRIAHITGYTADYGDGGSPSDIADRVTEICGELEAAKQRIKNLEEASVGAKLAERVEQCPSSPTSSGAF